MEFASPITPKDNTFSEEMQMDMISKKLANDRLYAYHGGRFWFWDEGRSIWKESHLLAKKYNLNHEYDKLLTPEDFLSDPSQFQALEDYEVDYILKSALQNAQPCKNAPIDPVEETAVVPAQAASPAATAEDKPAAPSFDFGADDQTNALLLQDAQTFITGNMARIMAAKHAHDLTANHYKGSWGKWCAAVGISRDTGDNMVRVAEQFGNIQLEGKSIFDVQPMKLLYAAAKPSTPEEVKQAVFTGDITTYKEYQEVMAQLKAKEDELAKTQADLDHEISQNDALLDEKGRLLREYEASKKARMDAENRADTAEGSLTAALADVQGLTEQNAKLQQSYHDADESRIAANLQRQKAEAERDRAEARAKDAENQLAGSRQVAEAAKLRGDKLKAENDALKSQPITAVVDEEEVDRRAGEKAYQMAAEMTAELRAQLEQASSGSEQDAHSSYDNVLLADRSFQNIGKMVIPSLRKLPQEQREAVANQLIRTLGQIQGEVSQCL